MTLSTTQRRVAGSRTNETSSGSSTNSDGTAAVAPPVGALQKSLKLPLAVKRANWSQ